MTDDYGRQVRRQRDKAREELAEARAERDLLRGMAERIPETHMQFGVISPDGTVEMQPCADWCWACKLDAAKARAEQTEAELALLRAGEEPDDGMAHVSTPGQWIREWNQSTPEKRLAWAEQAIDLAERSDYPMPAELAAAEARIAAVQTVLDRYLGCASDEAAVLRAEIRAAIDGPAEQPTCCVCGTTEHGGREFYENYQGKLFCWPCADGDRLCDCHQPPIRASQHDPGLQPDLDKLAELARLEARVRAKLSTIGMTMVFTDPIEQLAAEPATLAQFNDRWPQGPVNGISAYPLVPDDTLPPGEVHLRPHPRTADGPS